MLHGFLIGGKERCVEDRVNLPLGGNSEAEGCSRDDLFDFKWTASFHLEFLGSVHVKVGGFKPDLVSSLPRDVLRGYSLFHSLLGYFMGGLSIVTSSG